MRVESLSMKCGVLVVLAMTLLVPISAWAGFAVKAVSPAPALGEVGLIALGVGLVGAGVAYLRKR
jgi:hypothetical protein